MSAVSLNARPTAVDFDPASTAVMVIDMQNDFGSDGGMFHRAGLDIAPIQRLIPRISAVLAAARAIKIPIIYTRQEHRPDLMDVGDARSPHRIKHERLNVGMSVQGPGGEPSRILVRDTWNTAIVRDLAPEPSDIVISKHRYSAFFETPLDTILRQLGVETLIFTGATTSVCVESTLRDATFRDYRPIVLSDCTEELIGFGTARSNHEASLLTIELLFGWVAQSEDAILALSAATSRAA